MTTWEPVKTRLGRGDQVAVSWRITGGRATPALAVSLSKSVCERMGLEKNEKGAPVQRVVVERDRVRGRVRLRLAPAGLPRSECRHMAWKDKGCTVGVPLDDVKLTTTKPAQDVPWSIEDGWLVVKLPPWACPPIRVLEEVA
jgi:hypothetical protein